MSTRAARLAVFLTVLPLLPAAVPQPADWVPARWPYTSADSLALLEGSSINCLLLTTYPAELIHAAAARNVAALAVLTPQGDVVAAAHRALGANVSGLVLLGDFAEGTAASVREAANGTPVIELTARSHMALGSSAPVIGTYQGVWPGIPEQQETAKKAGPSGSVWIDTNTGFIRAVRAWGPAALWIANEPPAHTVITAARYQQVIADAESSGARWVMALDRDLAARLEKREPAALADWKKINVVLSFYESHPEWRRMREFGRLALVQDPSKGGLLSGGILDMIAVKHTPVRPIPRQRLSPEALAGATMAVDVDAQSLTPEQKEVLRNFARSGGTLLTGPPGWQDTAPQGESITLDQKELERLNDIWHDVNSMVGRSNLGVRLFNVSTMLSNAIASSDGKTEIVHLVNYSDYPVDDVTLQFVGAFHHATLLTPDGAAKPLEIYKAEEETWGVDIAKVGVCATIKLEQ